jgi:hypothetical protein
MDSVSEGYRGYFKFFIELKMRQMAGFIEKKYPIISN